MCFPLPHVLACTSTATLQKLRSKANKEPSSSWLHHYLPALTFLPQTPSFLTRTVLSSPFLKPLSCFKVPGISLRPPCLHLSLLCSPCSRAEPRPLLPSRPRCPGSTFSPLASSLTSPLVRSHLGTPVGQPTWVAHCQFTFNITKIHSAIIC